MFVFRSNVLCTFTSPPSLLRIKNIMSAILGTYLYIIESKSPYLKIIETESMQEANAAFNMRKQEKHMLLHENMDARRKSNYTPGNSVLFETKKKRKQKSKKQ